MTGISHAMGSRWSATAAACLVLLALGTLPSCRSRPSPPPEVGSELLGAMLTGDLDGAAAMFADGFEHNGKAGRPRELVGEWAAEARKGGEAPETMVAERFSGRYSDTIGDESPLPDEARQRVRAAGERLGLSGGDLVVILGSEKSPFWLWLYWKKDGGQWKVVASEG